MAERLRMEWAGIAGGVLVGAMALASVGAPSAG